MISMTWRQHRAQLGLAALIMVALGCYLFIGGLQRREYANSIGLSACLATHGGKCGGLVEAFSTRFGGLPAAFVLLAGVPLLAGIFLGAPLVAREVETGTHRLVWTQSVTRNRWMVTKLVALLAAVVLGTTALSFAFSWWIAVVDRMSQAGYVNTNRLNPIPFDLTGLVPVGAGIFAFALGTAAGALIRRSVPAIAATIGAYLAVVLPLNALRYHIFPALMASGPFGSAPIVQPGAYTMATGYRDAAGHTVDFGALMRACATPRDGNTVGLPLTCLEQKGFEFTQLYQPASRYWPLQWIEFSMYATAAALLLVLAIRWTTRRIS
jgi:hypothetical protein